VVDETSLISEAARVDIDVALELHHVKPPFGNIGLISFLSLVGDQFEDLSDVLDDEFACLDELCGSETQTPN